MCRRLLFTTSFYLLFFTTVLSLRCYIGTDRDCVLSQKPHICGSNETCQCAKYRFQCTPDNQACNENEQSNGITKWGYKIVSKNECETMKTPSSGYNDVACCLTSECNRPATGKCSEFQARRRAARKLTDLIDV